LTRLVADLIDLSRLQSDDPLLDAREVWIDEVVAEAVDTVETAAARQQITVVVGGTTGLAVYGVEDQLITALRNLLANAIAYSQPKTRVAVAVAAGDGTVSISVKDQGIGIAQGEIDRIFERFYRVDPARSRVTGGTGLGLSLVKHICQNHGGEISVWSVPGEGSTFTLRLPQLRDDLVDDTGELGLAGQLPQTPPALTSDGPSRPAQPGGGRL
jgi:two-component system sensor histidine kinase SenX3